MKPPNKSPRWTAGRIIISFIALVTVISPYVADWNVTHIYNPEWTPHAKFHNAQTMVLGTFLGLLSLYCLWIRKGVPERQLLYEAVVLASLYWLSQFPAILFPGTKLIDNNGIKFPKIIGPIELNQLTGGILILLPLIITGLYLENRRLKEGIGK